MSIALYIVDMRSEMESVVATHHFMQTQKKILIVLRLH